MGFGQGLSGLNAAAQNLDVIGNNIANSGTVGFKASRANFADVYANSKVGLGAQVSSISQRFSMGTISATGNELDIAIDGAQGLFRLQDEQGGVMYSRNGQFHADANQYIVNAQGQRLTGYMPGTTQVGPIRVPTGNIAPLATSSATVKTNLDANAPVLSETGAPEVLGQVLLTDAATGIVEGAPRYYRLNSTGSLAWVDAGGAPAAAPSGQFTSGAGVAVEFDAGGQILTGSLDTTTGANTGYTAAVIANPFDPARADSFTHSLPMTVYDSLGNSHQMTQYYVKRDGVAGTQSQWDVYYRLDGKVTDLPAGGGPVSMTFSSTGMLTSTPVTTITMNNPGSSVSPAEPLTIEVDYRGSTQYGGEFSASFNPTGYATGEYVGMTISSSGDIVASYTNGQTQNIGSLALANFANMQGLKPIGGNAWTETSESGQPILGKPGDNGLSNIKGQSVEESNVDMSQELVNMIIAQRTYQANAQTIKTQDQVMQTLISMR